MEWLKSWLLSMTCAAMVAALADALCPGGLAKKLTRMAGGLLLLLAALTPVRELDQDALNRALAQYGALGGEYEQAAAAEKDEMIKSIIARETAAYISDKAVALGIDQPQVRVDCDLTAEGVPALRSIEMRGTGSEAAWQALEQEIIADFAQKEEDLHYERVDGP